MELGKSAFGGNDMKCPECGNELKKGVVETKNAGSLTQSLTMVSWYPEEYKRKLMKKDTVNLRLKADGYYCDECMKVYAIFEEKFHA
jgi:hypothetical protein